MTRKDVLGIAPRAVFELHQPNDLQRNNFACEYPQNALTRAAWRSWKRKTSFTYSNLCHCEPYPKISLRARGRDYACQWGRTARQSLGKVVTARRSTATHTMVTLERGPPLCVRERGPAPTSSVSTRKAKQ